MIEMEVSFLGWDSIRRLVKWKDKESQEKLQWQGKEGEGRKREGRYSEGTGWKKLQ